MQKLIDETSNFTQTHLDSIVNLVTKRRIKINPTNLFMYYNLS